MDFCFQWRCRKLTDTTDSSELKLSKERRIIKRVLEISGLKIVVLDNEIAKYFGINGNTYLEQLLIDGGILFKIESTRFDKHNSLQ